ncbi:MAG: hypothetical protein K1X92_00675 [Bacteroidia bacterium]|nr:hypothetical protein [Bacteroidia bacterium]
MIWKVYPRLLEVPPFLADFLNRMYPAVPWQKVRFYEGMPWFAPKWASAIVLPHPWHFNTMCVYYKQFDFLSPTGLSTIAHEGMHILQAFELQKAKGLGYYRGFLIYYNILSLIRMFQLLGKVSLKKLNKSAYRSHPMEIPAYNQGDKVFKYLHEYYADNQYSKLLHHHEVVSAFMDKYPDLVKINSGTRYDKSIPKYFAGALITIPIALVNPVILIFLKGILFLPYLFFRK